MGDVASSALRRPPPSDAERQRIRELSRYYCTIKNVTRTSALDNAPSLSPDITLNALTQLAIYRFQCKRAFVSLIDGQNQHIISETTASISLRDTDKHLPNDGIYLGVSTLDLAFGVCPEAVKLFTGQPVTSLQNTENVIADRTRFIVRDFSKDNRFKDRPYVTQWPFFRFYAEVPIYSPSGYVLGSFCVVDDKPRQGFNDSEVIALQEISDSISQHLENVRTVHSHQRSDRLVHGLISFAKSGPKFCQPSTTEEHRLSAPSTTNIPTALAPHPPAQPPVQRASNEDQTPSTEQTEEEVSALSGTLVSEPTETTSTTPHSQSADPVLSAGGSLTKKHVGATEQAEVGDRFGDGMHLDQAQPVGVRERDKSSKRIAAVFGHASDLLRDSMDLDGVLFLDAGRCNSGIVHSAESVQWEPLPTSVDPKLPSHFSHLPNRPSKEAFCDTLGVAVRQVEGHSAVSPGAIRESLLQHLITAFPYGEVFDLEDASSGTPTASLKKEPDLRRRRGISVAGRGPAPDDTTLDRFAAVSLLNHFPEAKSVIFLPLWDWDKHQWVAGTFLWTRDAERALGIEELHYFKAFGDSIISEVARLNWSKQQQSKSSFVSSISHELRSPLHGMLASVELLAGTELQDEQRDIVKMLETCGLTLLDTMTHLLDFTKINNLTTLKNSAKENTNASIANLLTNFDLSQLLEDVVSTMYLGKTYAASPSQTLTTSAVQDPPSATDGEGELSVVVRIEREVGWKVLSTTGAWRRIIMNILGNALKYTQNGFVEVSLSKLKQQTDLGQSIVHLSVTDSGCGMSPDFLRNRLFAPFTQENHLSEGVGLGLSIVQQLVTLLDGSIDLRSEPGVGTQVDIFIPVQDVTQPSDTLSLDASSLVQPTKSTRFCLVGLNAYSDLTEAPTGTLSRDAKRRLCIQSFFTHIVNSQLGWRVTFSDTFDNADGDVAIVEETGLRRDKNELLRSIANTGISKFIILNDAMPSDLVVDLSSRANVIRLPQPLTPQKVLDALRKISDFDDRAFTTDVNLANAAIIEPPGSIRETEGFKSPEPFLKTEKTIPKPTIDQLTRSHSDSATSISWHVLIVDDNPINVKVLSKFMVKLGWTFDTAPNGQIALDKYKASPAAFKLLLMDISMPVMDGVVATDHVRIFEQENSLTPVTIFAVTGIGSTTMRQQALSSGVDDYIMKPLSFRQLEIAMKTVKHGHMARREAAEGSCA